ncbi:MAG: hypothetical protein M3343_06160 [Actinomycetota bacterium]|nr:hypothetical protein [Actinomycetota bacterium]
MGMVVILLDGDGSEVMSDAHAFDGLGELGITNVELLRDDVTSAIVADGWAFDAADSHRVVSTLLPTSSRDVSILYSVGRMSVN